jgi:hypothetical protein
VPLGDSGLSFRAPEGWTYAKLPSAGIAVAEQGAAAIALHVLPDPIDPKKKPEDVATALVPLLEQLKVTDINEKAIKARLRKPAVHEDANGLSLSTWELAGKVGEEDGMLLVIVTSTPVGGSVLGGVAIKKSMVEKYAQASRNAYLSLRSEQ